MMIQAGYALPVVVAPHIKYADLFQKLYQEAQENKRGLWKNPAHDEKPQKRASVLFRDKDHRYGRETYGSSYRPKLLRKDKLP